MLAALMGTPPSGTVTFLFSAVDRSADLWERHPSAMPKALQQHDRMVLEAYEGRHGHVFKESGGALCVAFDRAAGRVLGAVGAAPGPHRNSHGSKPGA